MGEEEKNHICDHKFPQFQFPYFGIQCNGVCMHVLYLTISLPDMFNLML